MYSTNIDGEVLEFGTSGLLYRSNKLMYDRKTNTLWVQFLGEPVVGPLADSGLKLEVQPVLLTTWGDWLAAHPDTTVLSINTGVYPAETYLPESDPASVYYDYRQRPDNVYPVWQRSDLLPAKAQVLGLNVNGRAKAYPLDLLDEEPVVNDSLGGENVVVVTASESRGARAYERGANRFSLAQPNERQDREVILVDQRGGRWRVEEEALVHLADPSQRFPRLSSHVAYWFGWYAFYPGTAVYGQPASAP